MKFKEKASSLALCAVLLGTSIAPVSAASKETIIGLDRYETAAKIADNLGEYNTAILVNSDKSLADGLSASSLAGKENAPILLVKRDTIPASTLQRLKNVKKVYIIGGEAAISGKVEKQLKGKSIKRIEGKDRVETSEKVAALVGNYSKAFIVNGHRGEADAMSAAPVASREKAPIILTNGKNSAQSKKAGVEYYVVGGEAVVSNELVKKFGATRLSGSDRYSTNRAVVQKFYPNANLYYYAKGNPLVDALTVSPLAKNNGVVLVSANSDNTILKDKDIIQVGGMKFDINFGENSKPVITSSVDKLEFDLKDGVDIAKFGIKASDKEDGDLTGDVVITQLPDMSKPGTYQIHLSVKDSKGAEESKVLTVVVKDSQDQKPGANDINSAAYQEQFREEFYKLVNNYRSSKGLNTVSSHPLQEKMTYLKSKHMIDNNYFDHFYQGKLIDRIYPEIFTGTGSSYGQEIITGVLGNYGSTPEGLAREAFERWQRSTGHEQTLTYDIAKYVGVGIYSGNGNIYVTAAFSHK